MEEKWIHIKRSHGLLFKRLSRNKAYCRLDEHSGVREVFVPEYVTLVGKKCKVTYLLLTKDSNSRFVHIPETVSKLGADDHIHLMDIDVSPDNEYYVSVEGVLFTKDMTELIKYPPLKEGCRYDVPDTVKKIGYGAFCNAKYLNEVRLPDGLEIIEEAAFENCSWLRSINLPDSITLLDDFAFAGCRSLEHVHIPKNIDSIGESVFHGCYSLRSAEIPDGVKYINNCAFNGCSSLGSVNIPKSVKFIHGWAFGGCPLMKDLKI